MAAESLLRLAWEVDRDGRKRVRDSILTLAVLESGPDDTWADRCRVRLIADRPEHFLAAFPTIGEALGDPRVIETRDRLRVKHPLVRVERLLIGHKVARGPYTGRSESIAALVEDLAGVLATEPDHVRLDAPQPTRGPLARSRVSRPAMLHSAYRPHPSNDGPAFEADPSPRESRSPEEFAQFYLSVLLAIACLMACSEGEYPASAGEGPGSH